MLATTPEAVTAQLNGQVKEGKLERLDTRNGSTGLIFSYVPSSLQIIGWAVGKGAYITTTLWMKRIIQSRDRFATVVSEPFRREEAWQRL